MYAHMYMHTYISHYNIFATKFQKIHQFGKNILAFFAASHQLNFSNVSGFEKLICIFLTIHY